jgi:peptide/nickel transport system substrate-binding protein
MIHVYEKLRRKEEKSMKKFLSMVFLGLFVFPLVLFNGEMEAWAQETKGKRFIWAREHEFDNLDPHLVYDVSRVAIRINMYDGLYRWQKNPPEIEPWVAKSYKVSADGLKWTFRLREGVKFHDGSEVTAEAVQYSIERLLALGQGAAPLFKEVVSKGSTRIVDKYTVEFNLSKPYAPFLSIIPELHIVNPRLCKANEVGNDWGSKWLASHEAGSGAYQLASYDPAVGNVMKRFKDHFMGWGSKYVEEVEFRTMREVASKVLALQKGEIHAGDEYSIPVEQLEKLKKDPSIYIVKEPSMRTFVFQIHNQRPPLNDVHVRRAISYAFDYEGFIKNVMGGTVSRNTGPIPNNMWGAPKDLKGYEYNLEKAKKELALAQVKIDRPLKFYAMIGIAPIKSAGLILQSGLAQIGIKLEIVEETWPVLTGKATNMDTSLDMWAHYVSTYYPDPNNWIGEMYNSANHGSWKASSWYKNPKVDEMLNRALKTVDMKERKKLYEEASRIVVEDAASIWIYNTDWYCPFRKSVRGVRYCPVGSGQEVRGIYLEE